MRLLAVIFISATIRCIDAQYYYAQAPPSPQAYYQQTGASDLFALAPASAVNSFYYVESPQPAAAAYATAGYYQPVYRTLPQAPIRPYAKSPLPVIAPAQQSAAPSRRVLTPIDNRAQRAIASMSPYAQFKTTASSRSAAAAAKDAFVMKPPPGVAPKFTGSFKPAADEPRISPGGSDSEFDEGPISNPAAFYLEGANLDRVPSPKCRMEGCVGPMPDDGSFALEELQKGAACHHTFVPLNGCVNDKGYPVGMVCRLCCDCSAPFVHEFKKSRGYKTGFSQAPPPPDRRRH